MPYRRRRVLKKKRKHIRRVRKNSQPGPSNIPPLDVKSETDDGSSTASQSNSNPESGAQTDSSARSTLLSDIRSTSESSRSVSQPDVTNILFSSSHSDTVSDTNFVSSSPSVSDLNEVTNSLENNSYFDMSIPIFDVARSNSSTDNNDLPFNIRFPDYLEMDYIRFPPAEVEGNKEDTAPSTFQMTPWRVRYEQQLSDEEPSAEDGVHIRDSESPGLLDKLDVEAQEISASMENAVLEGAHAVLPPSTANMNMASSSSHAGQEIQRPELATFLYSNECYYHMTMTHSQKGLFLPNLFFEPNFDLWLNPPEPIEELNNANSSIAAIRAYAEVYFSNMGLSNFNLKPVWTEPRLQIFEIVPTSIGPISTPPILSDVPVTSEEDTRSLTNPLHRSPACMNLAGMVTQEERTEETSNVTNPSNEGSDSGTQIIFSKLSLFSDSESSGSNEINPDILTDSMDDDNCQADDEASPKTPEEESLKENADGKKSDSENSVEKQQEAPEVKKD